MAVSSSMPPTGGGNPPNIVEIAPDVVTIAADVATGGIALEIYDATAQSGFRTLLDIGDALHTALRIVTAATRLIRSVP
jgi:hypothetical protein